MNEFVPSVANHNCSKSLNIMYFCRYCISNNLEKVKMYGQSSYLCHSCGHWEGWNLRHKISRYNYHTYGINHLIPLQVFETKMKLRYKLLIVTMVGLGILQLIRIWQ